MKKIKNTVLKFVRDEKGLGTLEILLILAVLVAIAILFRESITGWVSDLLGKTGNQIDQFDPAQMSE